MKKIQILIFATLAIFIYSNVSAQNGSGTFLNGSSLIVPFSSTKSDTAKSNILDKSTLRRVEKLICSDNSYKISSFTLIMSNDSVITETKNHGDLFSPGIKKMIDQMKSGTRAWIEDIISTGPDGIEKVLPGVKFKIK